MEKIYRVLKTVALSQGLTRRDFIGFEDIVDECLEKDYLRRRMDVTLEITEFGREFIQVFEEVLGFFADNSFFMTF